MTTSANAQIKRQAERQLILAAMNDGWTMNQDIQDATGLKQYVVAQNLADMADSGMIVRKRRGVYHVADKFVAAPVKVEAEKTKHGIMDWLKSKLPGIGTD